jgi:hypothetical protein
MDTRVLLFAFGGTGSLDDPLSALFFHELPRDFVPSLGSVSESSCKKLIIIDACTREKFYNPHLEGHDMRGRTHTHLRPRPP